MRKILGFGAILSVTYLGATVAAFGQAGGPATVGGALGTTSSSSLVTAPTNLEQKANQQAAANGIPAANTAVPGVTTAAPGGTATLPGASTGAGINTAVPGSTVTPAATAGVVGNTATPTNYQGPTAATTTGVQAPATTTGNVANQPGATYTPGLANPGEWNYRTNAPNTYAPVNQQGGYPGTATAATPGYTGRVMPGMPGYNAVNPMGTTMAPSYYYAGSAGMPYATYNQGYTAAGGAPFMYGATTAYPRAYVTPGANVTTTGPYIVQRRGLFGRRNRIVYPASPYGYSTYGSYPSGYSTYNTTTYYSTPGAYRYGNTTYVSPGSYTYGSYPY